MQDLTIVEILLDNFWRYHEHCSRMTQYTSRQAAKRLGIGVSTLSQYISRKKIPAPKTIEVGGFQLHSWTDEEIEHVRQLLPKIANGRKTRYKKQSTKAKAQPRAAVPHKTRKPKKKK